MKFIYENGMSISGDVDFPTQSIVSGTDTSNHNTFDDLDIVGGGLTLNGDRRENWNLAPVPVKGIVFWYPHESANIPEGWAMCSGGDPINGVAIPDLRDKFIVGVNTSLYNIDEEDGYNDITLTTAQLPAHTHGTSTNSPVGGAHTHTMILSLTNTADSDTTNAIEDAQVVSPVTLTFTSSASTNSGNHNHGWSVGNSTASGGADGKHENRPPFYALILIIRTTEA